MLTLRTCMTGDDRLYCSYRGFEYSVIGDRIEVYIGEGKDENNNVNNFNDSDNSQGGGEDLSAFDSYKGIEREILQDIYCEVFFDCLFDPEAAFPQVQMMFCTVSGKKKAVIAYDDTWVRTFPWNIGEARHPGLGISMKQCCK